MQISPKVKKQLRWQNRFFVILFLIIIGLLAWLSTRYDYEADLTHNQRNTPSEATLLLLEKIISPIEILVFVSNEHSGLRSDIEQIVASYQRFKPNITSTIIDPVKEPEMVRTYDIRSEGEIIVKLGERQEIVRAVTEQNLTNALQRLARTNEQWILFLEGHGERSPSATSNFDFSSWAQIMKNKGLMVRAYNLASNPNIPDNTALLVIADPQRPLLPGEMDIILDFLDAGGNLLWLLEPDDLEGLEPLAETLGIELLQGMVVDPNTELLGINDTRFTIIPEYPRNPVVQDFNKMTIFPTARAFEPFENEEWEASPLLETLPRTWLETEEYSPDVSMDPGQDVSGPLLIGLSLTRLQSNKNVEEFDLDKEGRDPEDKNQEIESESERTRAQQRVVIIGDNDFASDTYVGQAGNLDFVMNVVNWLVEDESFINIPAKTSTDSLVDLSKTQEIVIGFGFLLVIPVSLLLSGLVIWLRRRKN